MDDKSIVALYWQRSEQAIEETHRKFGKYCYSIAYHILANNEDAEESVSDTYVKVWNSIPPQRPTALAPFLGKIVRNTAISKWRARSANKRGGGEIVLALEELGKCVSGSPGIEDAYLHKETVAAFRSFLDTLPDVERNVFLRRYFFLDSVAEIAGDFGFTQGKVKSMLHRTRGKLRAYLEKEDLI